MISFFITGLLKQSPVQEEQKILLKASQNKCYFNNKNISSSIEVLEKSMNVDIIFYY